MLHCLDKLSQRHIYISAIVLSLLFSIINYGLSPNMGVDGILYLRCAAAYDQSGLKAAMELYPWPFYSILIAMIHHLGFSYLGAGRLLDALLQAWLIYFFIRIIFHFNSTPRIGLWALLCILCCSALNGDRSLLLRDFGYWAFYLTSLWLVLTFFKIGQKRYLCLFGLSILIAALFRVEGVIIAASVVVLAFFMPNQSLYLRIRNSVLMAWPFWLGALLFMVMGSHHFYGGGRLPEIYHGITKGAHDLQSYADQTIRIMQEALEPYYPFMQASKMYFSMLVGYFIYKIALTTGFGFSLLALYAGISKTLVLNSREKILLYGLMIVQLGMLAIFLVDNLFLTARYVLALSLLILMWSSFGVEQIYQKTKVLEGRKQRLAVVAAMVVFFIFSLLYSVVHIGPSKQYIRDATQWLQQRVGVNDRILVNDASILYQVKGPIATWDSDLRPLQSTTTCQFPDYRYVAIKILHHQDPLAQCPNLTLLKSYRNARGDTVNIYGTNQP